MFSKHLINYILIYWHTTWKRRIQVLALLNRHFFTLDMLWTSLWRNNCESTDYYFSCYTLMTLLIRLSVILLSVLMILLSILSVIRHMICGNNLNWLLNLNLIYETLWTGVRSGLLILMLGKLSWFRLTSLITMVLLIRKWMDLFLRKNHVLRCWGWPSPLNCIGVLILSLLLKLLPRKL